MEGRVTIRKMRIVRSVIGQGGLVDKSEPRSVVRARFAVEGW